MEQMKILHFEDDPNSAEIVERMLSKHAPESTYLNEDAPYCASPIIALEQPDVLICDYQFKHATLHAGLLDGIRRFKGLTYVLSSYPKDVIKKLVPELPDNVRIFDKSDVGALIDDICADMLVTV